MPRLVGIFGGTFDPVHYGHSLTIAELLNTIPFEKILVIPNSLPPHRENSQASFSHRYKMTSLAFRDIEKTVVDNRENLRTGPSHAIETVKQIIAEEGKTKVILIVGSDSFDGIHSWYKWRELISLVDFLILKRLDMPLSKNKNVQDLISPTRFSEDLLLDRKAKSIFEIEMTPLRISSSLIRENIAKGKSIDNLINPLVKDYLKKHGLYGSKNST
ncbi:MAG TPA: nicotinate (nicotinamide) nucleotide adenylyltransferase [Gammaproteobacteria bacterium]|jgi:nicotinate-nucleotide adenylyltransferase|nr:nicotinate (nicotinamide) nucleotide adenylyltransferase [Gammaproteobacteria bacterium]HIA42864.1 nicotinate (nicotinamide) nucleotide adenylyltransferase [Gammaproteobacteria bacterium]HIA95656.1 nicotinate (nicotinamide) nucleotide adenylyltransferase [Gammaproteobacteria bacterium]HIB75867.1 nicotinate (nicotinamide) nucleotide adenylyltransferase [Gammaproteobacteria bacterium]HIG49557.1 nicotinate (nicotinamide) nucleotide adenylyltransferase [Gammaproteobacteria bacterium]|tara:strand:+ start:1744 stop:2391 length:648 start_codon:yes stop_codon:yes gene_type:complete